jgi:hypothetical protein
MVEVVGIYHTYKTCGGYINMKAHIAAVPSPLSLWASWEILILHSSRLHFRTDIVKHWGTCIHPRNTGSAFQRGLVKFARSVLLPNASYSFEWVTPLQGCKVQTICYGLTWLWYGQRCCKILPAKLNYMMIQCIMFCLGAYYIYRRAF